MKKLLTTLSLLALASTGALADEKPAPGGQGRGERPSPEDVFKKLDTDGDGKLSLEEFKAHRPPGGPERDGPRKGGERDGQRKPGPKDGERKAGGEKPQ